MSVSVPDVFQPPDGILLVNLGTPQSPTTGDVKKYLDEFLMDPFVIDLFAPLRWLLVKGIILQTRPRKSAKAYQEVWTDEGSPLMVFSKKFHKKLQVELQDLKIPIVLGMRYGQPSLENALEQLKGCRRILVWPLYPQYAESSTETVLKRLNKIRPKFLKSEDDFYVRPAFYKETQFRSALHKIVQKSLENFKYDHLLISFHGLPKRHLQKIDVCRDYCFKSEDCCFIQGSQEEFCYRRHCVVTANHLATDLGLHLCDNQRWSFSFQSRLGPGWIQPFTDVKIKELAHSGVRRLAIVCPAFVADCLETIYEIGIEGRKTFLDTCQAIDGRPGTAELKLVPCLNDDPDWIHGAAELLRRACAGTDPSIYKLIPDRVASSADSR